MGLFLSWWIATAFDELPSHAWWIDLVAVPAGVLVLGAFAWSREARRSVARHARPAPEGRS